VIADSQIDEGLMRHGFAAVGHTFRGSIIDNAKRFRLTGPAYNSMPQEQDGYFSIETARQLAGPFAALLDDGVREVGIVGATQVLKSVCGNVWLPYVMEHDPGDALVVFEADDKALSFADRRLMPTIKAHPTLFARIEQETGTRHDVTKTKIVSNSMSLTVGGLNDTTVSTFSYRYVWVSESWQHGSDGLLMKAIKRADRFPDTCKILIESQAGLAGEDLHNWAKGCHQVPLTWECPHCDGRQTWEFAQLRGEDFKARPVLRGPQVPPPAPGTYSGMTFDGAEAIGADGSRRERTIDERARSAYWQCYWCGYAIHDRPEIRQAIAKTYRQDYRVEISPGRFISPRSVVFYLPKESNVDNRFEASAKSYLTAKATEKFGNAQPLIDWHISERAVFYEVGSQSRRIPIITGSYNVKDGIPNEVCRVGAADAQQDDDLTAEAGSPKTGNFWAVARAIDTAGNMYQLDRAFVRSWDELKAFQDRNQITNENFGIDCSFFRNDIIDMAAHEIREQKFKRKKRGKWVEASKWFTWTMLAGDTTGRNSWLWPDKTYRLMSPMQPQSRNVTIRSQSFSIKVPLYTWSQLGIKDMLHALITGGGQTVKFYSLKREQLTGPLAESTRLKESGNLTYENQMQAEYRTVKKNGKPYWEKYRPQNHFWDAECMCLVQFGLGGYLGVAAPADESEE
jgi:hypothetical protein